MDEATKNKIRLILATLSTKPGVYRYLDDNGKVIYVGKAKNLKRRVSSYFNKNHDSAKVRMLVTKIRDIQTTIVDTEWEALLLENTLIKEYKPKYNILLKDDKTYPWLAVTKEDFPKVFVTRAPDRATQEVFGPYASVKYMNTLFKTLMEAFPVRTCKVLHKSSRPCLQYQLGKCPAPCADLISIEEYQNNIKKIIEILKGNSNLIIKQLQEEMNAFSEQWEFEKAQNIKNKLDILTQFRGRSVVVNPEITQLDVFTIVEDDQNAYVNFMRVMEGAVIQSYTVEIAHKLDKSKEELLTLGMVEIRDQFGDFCPTILLPFELETEIDGVTIAVPQRGDKKKLLDLSLKNAFTFMSEKNRRRDLVNPERRSQRVLTQLQKDLQMDRLPRHIECFDNSNTQGCEPVSAMVCFIDGKPAKNEYRHFLVKTVVGADDFATMEEVVTRRYSRLLEENKPLPDLIVIDGGKGQLNAAYRSLQALGIADKVYLIGIAERLEDIYRIGDDLPLYIDKKSEAQLLLQRIRDAVHDFGIAHHRKRRAKKSIESQLDHIPGIGKALKTKLLQKFKSIKRIKEASEEEIAKVVGPAKAKTVKRELRVES
ncbi:MAG: excinuclease ABC subunit UvrC [Bacteroidales bacterium]|nr:excinuclease ABC subunit UvrC [Bacteroidales bacterium]